MPSEKDLLNRARAFDLEALGEIYDRFNPGIYRYAMRLMGDTSLSEDCVAETFARFLKTIQSGNGPRDHLQAYLYRIAHNWIIDTFRQKPVMHIELEETNGSTDEDPLEVQVHLRMERHLVRTAIRKLTPDQQQVIALRFIEGWENDEVAVALQKPIGAVKALQHRAMKMLRKLLMSDEKESKYEQEG